MPATCVGLAYMSTTIAEWLACPQLLSEFNMPDTQCNWKTCRCYRVQHEPLLRDHQDDCTYLSWICI